MQQKRSKKGFVADKFSWKHPVVLPTGEIALGIGAQYLAGDYKTKKAHSYFKTKSIVLRAGNTEVTLLY